MRPQDLSQFEGFTPAADDASPFMPGQVSGPQGNALILELQRLRQAFDPDGADEARGPQPRQAARDRIRPARNMAHPPGHKRRRPRKQKGTIGRVIDVCLEQFGFTAPPPVEPARARRREPELLLPARPPRTVTTNPRSGTAASPTRTPAKVAPNSPAPINPPAMPVGAPRQRPQLPARVPQPENAVARWVGRSRDSLMAGVSFLVERDGLANNDNGPGESLTSRTGRSFERELRTGLRVLIIAGTLGLGWLTLVPLSGAVVVPGTLVVQSNVKTIQHPTGGVVAQIAVQNGMRVSAGDLLVRLDPTQAQASLQTVSKQLDEARARIARLSAERDGLPQPEFPPELLARSDDPAVRTLLASEETLFKARSNALRSQRDLLQSKVAQLGQEITGHESQVGSKGKELELIAGELTGVQTLYDKRLVPLTRLTTLQRESARIEGERGQLTSAIAETKSKIGEAQLQTVKLDQDFRTEVVKELGDMLGKEAELVQKGVSAKDIIERIDIRAPTSGLVHQLVAHTIGGVIRAGDPIMEIVPDSDDLQIEAHVDPKDIDLVHKDQQAFIKFSGFNSRTTPQLTGLVNFVSADTSKEQQAPAPFFTVRVTLPEDQRRLLASTGEQLVSGMQAEVFLQTGSRTMMNYLFKPILEQLGRAFVER